MKGYLELLQGASKPATQRKMPARWIIAGWVCATLLVVALRKGVQLVRSRAAWKNEDEALDRDLETTFDASDPIGRY